MTAIQLETTAETEVQKQALAYQLWEEAGRPDGQSEHFWFMACEMIDSATALRAGMVPPEWLQKAAGPADTKPAEVPDPAETLQEIRKRIAGRSAA